MSGGLKKMRVHINSVKNIQKITSSMKAVSISKFAKSEKKLLLSRPLGNAASQFYNLSDFKAIATDPHITLLAVTSDRGLCGSMHTQVCNNVHKLCLSLRKQNRAFDIVCVGEKAKFILAFEHERDISMVVNGIGHRTPNFTDASRIIHRVFKSDSHMQGHIIFPMFKNMAEFRVSSLWLYSVAFLLNSNALMNYEYEEDEFPFYVDFSQVVLLYFALCETYLVELAQRISVMSSASKNAKRLTDKLALMSNRKRQQMVTNELTDIVSSAQVIVGK